MAGRRSLTLTAPSVIRDHQMLPQHKQQMLADAERGDSRTRDLLWIQLDHIIRTPDELNSRVVYQQGDLEELAESIKENGVTTPVLVRPITREEADQHKLVINGVACVPAYALIAGNRRYLASGIAGKTHIPAMVRVAGPEQAFVLNLVENIQRRELSNKERLRAMGILANLYDQERGRCLSVTELSQRTGKSTATISTWLRIGAAAPLREALERDELDIGRAMLLTPLARPETMDALVAIVPQARDMAREELGRLVTETYREAREARPRRKRAASLNLRRLIDAYRLLMNVDAIGDSEESTYLKMVSDRAAELMD